MRKILLACIAIVIIVASCTKNTDTITIKGKVEFPDEKYKMMIYQRNGSDKIIVDTFNLNPDNSYSYTMMVDNPDVYYLDCQKHQRVTFWAEDENLVINFRGRDTAKIKIKNPPYVHIHGGPNNEVMNTLNFDFYRNYQQMIAISQTVYRGLKDNPEKSQEISGKLYSALNEDASARIKHIVKFYGDRNSVIAAIKRLNPIKDADLIASALKKLEARNPNDPNINKFRIKMVEDKAARERMQIGKPSPHFEYVAKDGKKYSPSSFKGKLLLIDFWASWCGPCRAEIPNVKEIYKKYHEKGVEIISVSIDKDKKKWLQALEEENMPWPQILTPDTGKQIMKDYQFSGIPFIILLDKDGKIVAKSLRGVDLEKAIEKELDK